MSLIPGRVSRIARRLLRTPLFWPEDNPETFALHVVVVLVIGAAFRLAGRSGPLERMTAQLAGRARASVTVS